METNRIIGKVSKITTYPVKGGGGIESDRAFLTPSGLQGDREFMVVRGVPDSNGVYNFVTQRDKRKQDDKQAQTLSILALIKPIQRDKVLRLTWNWGDAIDLPLDIAQKMEIPVRVWQTFTNAPDQGDEVAKWLSQHLEMPARLVRAAGSFRRLANQDHQKNNNSIRFQDGYPVLWLMQESVNELSLKAKKEIPVERFRANIVGEGGEPRVEHLVHAGEIAGIPFIDPKPCVRCPVTTVDQLTGQKMGNEPLATLATYKNWIHNGRKMGVILAENMLPLSSGEIGIGDEIKVTRFRDPPLVYS